MKNNLGLGEWSGRVERLQGRFELQRQDLRRSLSWHLGGGRKFFSRYLSELAAMHKWYFIVGCNNSGTSLLQSILERSGEVSTFPYEGQRYTRVLTRATKRGYERVWTEYLDDLRLTSTDSFAGAARLMHDWLGELSAPIQGAIVEKTTANAVRMEWLQQAFPKSYFIGVVRNGYAVVEGIRRKGHKTVERGARHWNLANKIMMQDAENIDNFIEVRYEDLAAKKVEVLDQLSAFTGANADRLKAAMEKNFGFATIRGEERLPVHDLNAESIAKLTAQDVKSIRAEAAEMLDYFGYVPGHESVSSDG